eukprot:98139_1
MAQRLSLILFSITSLIATYSKQCESGQECVVRCGSNNSLNSTSSVDCNNDTIINGTAATFLSFLCEERDDCAGYGFEHFLVIICPIGGCNITFSNGSYLERTVINASYTDNVYLNLNLQRCSFCELNAQYASNVVINVETPYQWGQAFDESILNVSYAKTVRLTVIKDDTFHASRFYALHAESVTITLSAYEWGAAKWSRFYVPSNTIWNCYGLGCAELGTIDTGTNLSESQFEINLFPCGECALHNLISDCFSDQFYGTAYTLSYSTYDVDSLCFDHDDKRNDDLYRNLNSYDHLYYDLQAYVESICEEGDHCFVDCTEENITCSVDRLHSWFYLDATKFSYLTVICDACRYSTIICPDNGCDIECVKGDDTLYTGCIDLYVVHNGTAEDEGEINIMCTAEDSCDGMTVEAHHASKVRLLCDDKSACRETYLYTYYANEVHVIANEYESAYFVKVSAYYANYVRLTAHATHALSGLFFTDYAKSVTIECLSARSCFGAHFYLPSNARVRVYGDESVYAWSAFFVQDGVQNLEFKNFSMGCNASDYFKTTRFGCGSGYKSFVNYGDCDEECGCEMLVDSIISTQECSQISATSDKTLSAGEIAAIVIGAIAAVAILTVAILIVIEKMEGTEVSDNVIF